MTTVAWWHCFAGIAGDMALGSLVDAGADLEAIVEVLRGLPVTGWHISAEPVLRCGVAATHVNVKADETAVVRTHAHIAGLLTEARLPERVRQRSLATFAVLAEVEGYTCEEIAEMLGVPVGTVWTRLHRARRDLRRFYGEASDDP